MKLKGKNIILTGASGGIGKLLAQTCDQAGARLFLISRSENKLKSLFDTLENKTSKYFVLDVSDLKNTKEVINIIDHSIDGKIDGLINTAGVQFPIGEFRKIDIDEWRRNFEINLFGTIQLTYAVLPHMIENNFGRIINFSGGGATGPRKNFSAYGVSKAAIVRFTETIAAELINYNICINAIAPGAINTNMLDEILDAGKSAGDEHSDAVKRMENGGDDPIHAAELVLFLASDEARGISGKLISAIWDPWQKDIFLEQLRNDSNLATLRRIDNKYYFSKK